MLKVAGGEHDGTYIRNGATDLVSGQHFRQAEFVLEAQHSGGGQQVSASRAIVHPPIIEPSACLAPMQGHYIPTRQSAHIRHDPLVQLLTPGFEIQFTDGR